MLIDHADFTVSQLPPQQHELDHTGQEVICPARSTVDHELGMDDLSSGVLYCVHSSRMAILSQR